jgi:hypothetical protein
MRVQEAAVAAAVIVTGWNAFTIPSANASVQFELGGADFAGTGATLPSNALTILFDDIAANKVRVTIDGTNLPAGTAKLKHVVWNIDPSFGSSLSFAYVSGVATNGAPSFSPNGHTNWGPAGAFDVNFSFNVGGPTGDFFAGQKSVYDIMGAGLDTNDFLFNSTGSSAFYAAFKLNITGNGQSGKYGGTLVPSSVIPEGASVVTWLGLAACATVLSSRRRGAAI